MPNSSRNVGIIFVPLPCPWYSHGHWISVVIPRYCLQMIWWNITTTSSRYIFSSFNLAIHFDFSKLKFCFEFFVHSVKWRWDGWQHFIDSHFKVNFVECQPFWSSIYQQSNFFTLRILPLKASCMMPAPASCTVGQKIFVKLVSRKKMKWINFTNLIFYIQKYIH